MTAFVLLSNIHERNSQIHAENVPTELSPSLPKNLVAMHGIGQHLSSTTLIGDYEVENASSSNSVAIPSAEREKLIDLNESGCTFMDNSCSIDEAQEFVSSEGLGERKPMDNVILPQDCFTVNAKSIHNETRHGISRYAPYGTRFAAKMKDGSVKTSHVAGDLANRARIKNGRGSRVDLVLATHEGERFQLDSALDFYETALLRQGPNPGPSEVLHHLKECSMDWDYRKGDGVRLLQRNASNFFKRMMEHAKRIRHPVASHLASHEPIMQVESENATAIEKEVCEAARILQRLLRAKLPHKKRSLSTKKALISNSNYSSNEFQVSIAPENTQYDEQALIYPLENYAPFTRYHLENEHDVHVWSRTKYTKGSFYDLLCAERIESIHEEAEYYRIAAENYDWNNEEKSTPLKRTFSEIEIESFEFDDYQTPVAHQKKKPKTKTPKAIVTRQVQEPIVSFATLAENPQPVMKKSAVGSGCVRLKGLSRHSPYGTRFCATMKSGEVKESFLAGDLGDRIRSPDGKSQSELILVLHPGEIAQLETAWNFIIQNEHLQPGAGAVMDCLRSLDLDYNYRKQGSRLLQKNAGNFFKRVQEYGRRKQMDPTYLCL